METVAAMRDAQELLRGGRWVEGFELWDRRRELGGYAPPLPFRQWQGEPVAGKRVLIWSEEGFGDQFLYARFVRPMVEAGAEVDWFCPASMARLLSAGLGVSAIPDSGSFEFGRYDFWSPSGRLAREALKAGPLPALPYLRSPHPLRREGARVGVMASGNPKHVNDANRSLDWDTAVRLMSLPGALDLAPEVSGAADFYETAQIMAGLDHIVTVDTAVANLAGAMGLSVSVLLPALNPDWRWGAGNRSPWYPGARLLRQSRPGDWASVVARLIAEFEPLR